MKYSRTTRNVVSACVVIGLCLLPACRKHSLYQPQRELAPLPQVAKRESDRQQSLPVVKKPHPQVASRKPVVQVTSTKGIQETYKGVQHGNVKPKAVVLSKQKPVIVPPLAGVSTPNPQPQPAADLLKDLILEGKTFYYMESGSGTVGRRRIVTKIRFFSDRTAQITVVSGLKSRGSLVTWEYQRGILTLKSRSNRTTCQLHDWSYKGGEWHCTNTMYDRVGGIHFSVPWILKEVRREE